MNDHQLNELKANIETMAVDENKTPLDIINELLTGAAKMGHEAAIDALLTIRQPLIQDKIDAVLSR
jgi:hypothetical protein